MRSVLIVRQDKLGDLLLTTPLFRALHEEGCRITTAVQGLFVPLMEQNEHVSHAFPIPYKPNLRAAGRFLRDVRRVRPDAVLLLKPDSGSYTILSRIAGVPVRIAATRKWYGRLMTDNLGGQLGGHEAERNLKMGEKLVGHELPRYPMHHQPSRPVADRATEDLCSMGVPIGKRFIVLHVGTGGGSRPWSATGFARVSDWIRATLGVPVVLMGSKQDEAQIDGFRRSVRSEFIDITDGTDLLQLGELFRQAALLVSTDTGPVHLAAAVGTPCVTIYPQRFSASGRWHPWMVPHRIVAPNRYCQSCDDHGCTYQESTCVETIEVDAVIRAIRDLWGELSIR